MYQNNILKRIREKSELLMDDKEFKMFLMWSGVILAQTLAGYKYGYDKGTKKLISCLKKNQGKDLIFWNRGKYITIPGSGK